VDDGNYWEGGPEQTADTLTERLGCIYRRHRRRDDERGYMFHPRIRKK